MDIWLLTEALIIPYFVAPFALPVATGAVCSLVMLKVPPVFSTFISIGLGLLGRIFLLFWYLPNWVLLLEGILDSETFAIAFFLSGSGVAFITCMFFAWKGSRAEESSVGDDIGANWAAVCR